MTVIGHGTEICTSTTRPSTAAQGLTIFETDTNKLLVNSSSTSTPSWVEIHDLDNKGALSDNAAISRYLYRGRTNTTSGIGANTTSVYLDVNVTVPYSSANILITTRSIVNEYGASSGTTLTGRINFQIDNNGTYSNDVGDFSFAVDGTRANDWVYLEYTRRITGVSSGSHNIKGRFEIGNVPITAALFGTYNEVVLD